MKRLIRNKYVLLSLSGGVVAAAVGAVLGDVPSKIASIGSPEDLLAIMAGRSPGTRADGALANKTKRPLVPAPKQKVLGEKDTPEVAMAVPVVAPIAAPLLAPAAAAVVPAAAAVPLAGGGFFVPPFILPFGGGGGGITVTQTPPSGGGGGGTPPPPPPPPPGPPPPPPPGPAVPEPETWLMMTLGFGALGGILRRRRRSAVQRDYARAPGTLPGY